MLTFYIFVFPLFVVSIQQYKYKEMTVREITNVISQYKDLKPVMDAYGKFYNTSVQFWDCYVYVIRCMLMEWHTSACVSVFNDGSTRDLMSLTGTVPVSYRGKDFFFCTLRKARYFLHRSEEPILTNFQDFWGGLLLGWAVR